MMVKKLWSGRFSKSMNPLIENFTASISFDQRLYPYDIQGSIAHVRMLDRKKIISSKEAGRILQGLKRILLEFDTGQFRIKKGDEDIHMAVERRLHELIGPVAGKLHTARSRNDQIILDVKLYLREQNKLIQGLIRNLQKVIVHLADKNKDLICPGFTHLQHAQPVLLAQYYLAYFEMLDRDYQRLKEIYERLDRMPLGAGALAGTNFPVDRHYVAKLLGFKSVTDNSMDTIADRDFIIEFLSFAAILQMHLSRLAEELVLWSSIEFGFIELPDEFCTGSSIMPQKKNPDVAELIRGKTGRVYGNLLAILTLMKGLPLTYNSDMQEDKPPLFDSVDTIKSCLSVLAAVLKGIKIKKNRLNEMAKAGFINATHLANYLTQKGIPFRQAHEIVGKLVKYAEKNNLTLEEIDITTYKSFHPKFNQSLYKILTLDYTIRSVKSYGGTGWNSVTKMIDSAKRKLSDS